jgi:hypothetical protein
VLSRDAKVDFLALWSDMRNDIRNATYTGMYSPNLTVSMPQQNRHEEVWVSLRAQLKDLDRDHATLIDTFDSTPDKGAQL